MSKGRVGRGPGRGHAMSMPVEKAKDFKGTLKRLLGYLKPRRVSLIFVVIMAICSTIFTILAPKIMGNVTTRLFNDFMEIIKGVPNAAVNFDVIWNILLVLGILYILSSLFSFIMQFTMASVVQKTVFNMREDVSRKLTKLPLKYYDSHTHGEILSRVTNDIDNISNTLQQSVIQLITSIITIVGVIIMMLTISPLLTLITITTLPLSIIITKNIAKMSQKYFKTQQEIIGNLNGHVEEMYTGHKIVKAYGHEKKALKEFEEINDKLYEAGWKAQFISGIIMPMMSFVNNLGYVFICIAGGILMIKKSIQLGDIQAFIQYSRAFGQPIVQTANIANIIQSTIASAERVFEVLDEEEEIPDKKNSVQIDNLQGNVRFEHVDFGYKEDVILINNMNIDVKKGQTVAIVGPTGAGKTTLVNLLMRFYELRDGTISIEGVNINDLRRSDLRNLFGMVLQDTWLFKGTIRDNIAYGKEGASEEEIIRATKAAHADHFIRTLPEGYDTVLNEEANNISQGQKQLLTIARAILANPSILILDEATSSVDTRTEIYIQKAMESLMKGRTSFVIAHRLSTIKDADMIIVMNNGDIIEKGNHQELLEFNGFYAELYNSQFVGSEEAV
ncbi:ABC transporter ATP-binding protein [Vallitalea sp.]|jgi:ATP-binding cassette subfamily B protein|uniref:ABC transporter ATP-binding protein n=1 Tax=Vallitalea sp. TaxID=1882829 RepID=UPI0025D8CC63|nr:ABC transporter ATP-binding protein [Vallitalea sp.]MCT4688722.1 ABC transporter ATP-binding protein/permease [Vallitalea sp.]